jgi:TolB-like protein
LYEWRQQVLNDQLTEQPSDPVKNRDHEKKKKKKKDKVRSAWISFAGRIVAQIVGALATVALGVTVLHRYSSADSRSPSGEDLGGRRSVVSASLPRPAGELSVAVLPLDNFSSDPEQEYFADGMTEALITDLSTVEGLHVISRTSSMQFKGQRKPLREIAQQLGVQWIVEGSVARIGKRVRITAQLIDAGTDQHAWAQSYDRPVTDVLAVQAEVAGAIAQAVSAALPPSVGQAAMLVR